MGESMLEGVGVIREETRLVEEFGAPKLIKTAVERVVRQVSEGVQQGEGYLSADDGGGWRHHFASGGNRSMRAATTPWTAAGISTCVPAFERPSHLAT